MRIEDIKDRVGPVPLGLLQLPPDLLPPGGAEDADLLPGHGLTALLHGHRGQGGHVRQRLLSCHGGVAQHLQLVVSAMLYFLSFFTEDPVLSVS